MLSRKSSTKIFLLSCALGAALGYLCLRLSTSPALIAAYPPDSGIQYFAGAEDGAQHSQFGADPRSPEPSALDAESLPTWLLQALTTDEPSIRTANLESTRNDPRLGRNP